MPRAPIGAGSAPQPTTTLDEDPLFARAPVPIVKLDHGGFVTAANQSAAELLGRVEPELISLHLSDVIHPEDRETITWPADDGVVVHDWRWLRPDGAIRRVRSRMTAFAGGFVLYGEDLTEQMRSIAVAELTTEARYEKLLQNIDDVITVCDEYGTILAILGPSAETLGWPATHWEGRSVFDFAHPDEVDAARKAFKLLVRMPGVPIIREFRTRDRDGTWAWLQFTATNLLDDPSIRAVVLASRNVTMKRHAESVQRSQSEIFELIAFSAPLELVLARLSLLVEEHVMSARAGFFLVEDGVLRPGGASQLAPEYVKALCGVRTRWFGTVHQALTTSESASVSDVSSSPWYLGKVDILGDTRATVAIPIDDDLSEFGPAGVLAIHLSATRDLTAAEELVAFAASRLAAVALQHNRTQQQLSQLAHHDHLTGLPNRANLQNRLDAATDRARAQDTTIAVMFLDVDNFKIVNDSLGHAVGDQALMAFAERLGAMLRPDDVVGRFGGDEFVVLIENAGDADAAVMVAERLLDDLRHPLRIGEHTVFLTVSIGIAVSPNGTVNSEGLLRNADSAMYQAKSRGRSRVEVYDDVLPERAARRLQLENDLHRALDLGQFCLHWQPKVALDTGRIVSAEALVRWDHPERGLIQPTEFIRVTEEIELINRIGAWVLDEAIRQRAEWEKEHGDEAPWSIAVNVSALQLAAPRHMESVLSVLERWQWSPDRLVLELTESVLMDEAGDASPILQRLKQVGVKLAIDDFGTGYSSLSYLHRFPVDQVKLDRSFVSSIQSNGEGSVIARAVINMAHALGISVTAEGVETEEQKLGLEALGCDRGQGFWFSPALPANEFADLLRKRPRYT